MAAVEEAAGDGFEEPAAEAVPVVGADDDEVGLGALGEVDEFVGDAFPGFFDEEGEVGAFAEGVAGDGLEAVLEEGEGFGRGGGGGAGEGEAGDGIGLGDVGEGEGAGAGGAELAHPLEDFGGVALGVDGAEDAEFLVGLDPLEEGVGGFDDEDGGGGGLGDGGGGAAEGPPGGAAFAVGGDDGEEGASGVEVFEEAGGDGFAGFGLEDGLLGAQAAFGEGLGEFLEAGGGADAEGFLGFFGEAGPGEVVLDDVGEFEGGAEA